VTKCRSLESEKAVQDLPVTPATKVSPAEQLALAFPVKPNVTCPLVAEIELKRRVFETTVSVKELANFDTTTVNESDEAGGAITKVYPLTLNEAIVAAMRVDAKGMGIGGDETSELPEVES